MIQPSNPFSASTARDPAAFVAALQAGNPIAAAQVAAAMLADDRPLRHQWQSVARFAATEGEWPIAIAAMQRFVADDPSIPRQLALAETLAQGGRGDEAATLLDRLAAAAPRDARVQHFRGVVSIEQGRRDEGVVALERAAALRPASGQTWLALANAQTFTAGGAALTALMAQGGPIARAPAAERAAWHYAVGKAMDDLGEPARAFAAFAKGARLVAGERRYDARGDRAAALASIEGVTAAWLADHARDAGPGRSLFVTGKPRSGTTLVARILTAHSMVGGGDELNLLPLAAAATGGLDPAGLRRRAAAGGDPWARFRDRHAHLVDARFPAAGAIVDKSLNTSRVAALVRLALPDAPLVWLRRDPLDTAWSSFRTYFARGVEWSFDLAAMGAYHALEDRLHAFWADAYGDRLLTLDYQALVDEPDATMTRLLTHCGLTDEPEVRNFHLGGGTVQTASVGQVRRPINRDGIDTAAPYRAQLAPYDRAYAQARAELGLPAL